MEEISGQVVKGPFATGSKSEHNAIFLISEKGRYVLRRLGGNPFQDPELEKLVGKTIRGQGVVTDYTFLLSDWSELK
ncbi:MAG: hypothetical protein LAO20_00615 [Acidobacteriia bacterium]|nr:hypothetical protein [Terriglobia bacterium]